MVRPPVRLQSIGVLGRAHARADLGPVRAARDAVPPVAHRLGDRAGRSSRRAARVRRARAWCGCSPWCACSGCSALPSGATSTLQRSLHARLEWDARRALAGGGASIPVAVVHHDQILFLTFTTILAELIVLATRCHGCSTGSASARRRRRGCRAPPSLRRVRHGGAAASGLERLVSAGEISHTAALHLQRDLDLEETLLSRR